MGLGLGAHLRVVELCRAGEEGPPARTERAQGLHGRVGGVVGGQQCVVCAMCGAASLYT